MGEKSSGKPSPMWSNRPVPMKLFGAWEIDKTPSNCIPRLCSLNITRLVLLKPLGPDVTTIMIAVKMQSSKRTLRSNEINVRNESCLTGVVDVELDLTFSLQYPHFLKRSGNQLQIMVQRRKRYKNRAILGFKTLAGGLINMAEVLQRSSFMDKELELLGNIKELGKNEIIARIMISSLKSQPVDQDNALNGRHIKVPLDRSADVDSDDEDFTSAEEGSDSETVEEPTTSHNTNPSTRDRLNQWRRQVNTRKARKIFSNNSVGSDSNAVTAQQRNLKQKFIALLKKFRLPDSEAFDSEEQYQAALEQELIASAQNSRDIDELFDEEDVEDVDDLSDSGQEFDDVSISSTPKPSLRPFFSSCTLVGPDAESYYGNHGKRIEYDSQDNSGPEQTPDTSDTSLKQHFHDEHSNKKTIGSDKEKKSKLFNRDKQSTSKDKERKVSAGNTSMNTPNVPFTKERSMSNSKDVESSPRKSVMDQLNRIFSSDDTSIPDQFMLINAGDGSFGQILAQLLERQHLVVAAHTSPDIKASFTHLSSKIQKFCNCNSRAPQPIRVAVLGTDAFINSVLRHYVETFSSKPPDWQNYLRFYIIPINTLYASQFVKYLGSIDSLYYNNFCNGSWKELFDEQNSSITLTQEIIHRIVNYLNGAHSIVQIPIAEAMVTYKEKSLDDESLQVFIPFVCDVKIGIMEGMYGSHSLDDECQALSSSPPNASLNNSHTSGSIEKSVSLTSPLSSKDQQISQSSLTPPSSPSINISANLIGTQTGLNPNTSVGAQAQLNSSQLQQLQGLQNSSVQSTPQQTTAGNLNSSQSVSISSNETMDLQIDYWPIALKSNDGTNKKADSSKFTLKNTFRTLQVSRLPNMGELNSQSLTLNYITKEKKQKIMRLGKKKEKERDPESKSQSAEGIYRLVCSCKTSQAPLKVIIDGVEWSGVKFFQLTAQWQTQIKYFPVALFSPSESNRNTNRINFSNSLTA